MEAKAAKLRTSFCFHNILWTTSSFIQADALKHTELLEILSDKTLSSTQNKVPHFQLVRAAAIIPPGITFFLAFQFVHLHLERPLRRIQGTSERLLRLCEILMVCLSEQRQSLRFSICFLHRELTSSVSILVTSQSLWVPRGAPSQGRQSCRCLLLWGSVAVSPTGFCLSQELWLRVGRRHSTRHSSAFPAEI